MERERDASLHVQTRYYPHQPLVAILEAESQQQKQMAQDPAAEAADSCVEPPGEQGAKPLNSWLETQRLRTENLSDEGADTLEEPFLQQHQSARALAVRHTCWKLHQARHQVLRELYALMELLGSSPERRGASAEGDIKHQLEQLQPLLDADAQLVRCNGLLWRSNELSRFTFTKKQR